MSKFKITNADSPIEKDLYQDIPIKDPDTGLDQVDSEGNILAKRYVTRSINKNGINNIKRALPQINVNKSEIARIDTYAKNQVDAINTSIRDIEDNVLQNQKDLSDHDTRISTIQSKLNNIQGIDIDEVQADVDALKKSAYLITGGVLKGDVSIQTPNTAVLTLTPKGSSSYASFSTTNDVVNCTTPWGKVFKASEEGKYFYGLADKATADKRGQDVTSYIRSIAGANATLTITKGDGTSQSLSINNVLQATKAIQDKNGAQIDTTYFKSANGTFTGTEYNRNVANSYLRLSGGNTRNGGAAIHLYGKDATNSNGVFAIGASSKGDGSDYKYLQGTPAGSLTWNGKNIVRSINNINADAFGNVAFTQLVTGLVSATYLAAAKGTALVASTAPAGAYVAFTKGVSKNGVFIQDVYDTRYEVHYFSNANISADKNAPNKSVTLLDEAGNSSFPGIVSGTFSGNLSGTASHATSADKATSATTATKATQDSAGQQINTTYVKGVTTSNATITVTKGNGTTSTATINNVANATNATNAGSATKASQNASGHTLADTIVKAISISGRTITVTKLDGKTYTLTTQDTNTWNALKGSTTSAAGTAGYAPAPAAGAANRYLRCDGTWQVPPDHTYTVNNATLTIQKNGSNVATFTANASSNVTANISVPTKVSQLTNDSSYITGGYNFASGVKVSGYTITIG